MMVTSPFSPFSFLVGSLGVALLLLPFPFFEESLFFMLPFPAVLLRGGGKGVIPSLSLSLSLTLL